MAFLYIHHADGTGLFGLTVNTKLAFDGIEINLDIRLLRCSRTRVPCTRVDPTWDRPCLARLIPRSPSGECVLVIFEYFRLGPEVEVLGSLNTNAIPQCAGESAGFLDDMAAVSLMREGYQFQI